MSEEHWSMDGYDSKTSFGVVWDFPPNASFHIRPPYEKLKCHDCGRIDEYKALRKGIIPGLCPPAKRNFDFIFTDDHLTVISSRTKSILDNEKGVKAKFFPFPGASNYWVVLPHQLIAPPSETRYSPSGTRRTGEAFLITKKACKACGRPGEVTCKKEWLEIPQKMIFGGVVVQQRFRSVTLIISEQLRQEFKEAKLTGWRVHSIKGPT